MSAKYYIYRNLRIENTFSLKLRGRVVHRLTDFVARNVTFKVNEAGRLRVNAERQKNVHAFVCATSFEEVVINPLGLRRVSYNPYKGSTFTVGGEPIFRADAVLFSGGHCFLL